MNISKATTAELVAFYNAHADKPVKKFADRKTAERRCAALLPAQPATQPKKSVASGSVRNRAFSIARSWTVRSVAIARTTRHAVRVAGEDGAAVVYRSTRAAFLALGLPLGQHIKFRGALKAAGRADFGGYKFRAIAIEK